MSVRTLLGHTVICLLISAAMTATAEGQTFYPYIGGPGMGSYLGGGSYYAPYLYNNPGALYNAAPHPPIGGYLPNQPQPPLPYMIPRAGLVPQPHPFYYQPPLYMPQGYIGPYYPPSMIPPYYYRYRHPYAYPRFTPWPSQRYRAMPRQWRNVAPVGSEPSLQECVGPLADAENSPAGSRGETP